MKNRATFTCAFINLLMLAALASIQAAPSIVVLDTGEQVLGELLPESTEETLVLQSALLGEIKLPRTRVLSIQAQAPVLAVTTEAAVPPEAAETTEAAVQTVPIPPAEEALDERKVVDALKAFKALDDWSGNLRMGMNISQGDRKWTETYAKGQLEIDPEQSTNFYRLTGSYTYRETERDDGSSYKSTDKYDAEFIYRRTFLENWFVQNALGYRADQLKRIDREAQETVGIGYRFKPSEVFNVLLGGGGGLEQYEVDFDDSREGLNVVANIFQEATWKPLNRTSFVQKFNYYWNPENSEQFNYVFTAAIRVRLTDLLGFEFSFNKSFDNDLGDGKAEDDTQWRNAMVIYF